MYEVATLPDSSVSLGGKLAYSEILSVRSQLEKLIEVHDAPIIVVSLENLESYNSQILSLCLCLIRKAKSLNVKLEFKNPPARLFDMARVGGLEFIFSH